MAVGGEGRAESQVKGICSGSIIWVEGEQSTLIRRPFTMAPLAAC